MHFADVLEKATIRNASLLPGSGAAGGLCFALTSCFDASLTSGADYLSEKSGFRTLINDCCGIITGEGCFDGQTFGGKAVSGILSNSNGIPV